MQTVEHLYRNTHTRSSNHKIATCNLTSVSAESQKKMFLRETSPQYSDGEMSVSEADSVMVAVTDDISHSKEWESCQMATPWNYHEGYKKKNTCGSPTLQRTELINTYIGLINTCTCLYWQISQNLGNRQFLHAGHKFIYLKVISFLHPPWIPPSHHVSTRVIQANSHTLQRRGDYVLIGAKPRDF